MTKKFRVAALPIVFKFVTSESGLHDVMELDEMSADKIILVQRNFGEMQLDEMQLEEMARLSRMANNGVRTDPNRIGQSDVP
jgi:uncharacterized protein with ATP-grasp and redox domains